MDRVKIILNPYGGRLPKEKKVSQIKQAFANTGLAYDLTLTTRPGQAIDLAQWAAQEGWSIIVAAGGDGTISEVVNGLMAYAGEREAGTLGILPLGTANDLADMLALPRNLEEACQRIVARKTRLIDVGRVNNRFFVNNSAVGLEPMVSLAHEEMRWVKGDLRYIVAAVKAIIKAKFWQMKLTWDEGSCENLMTLVSVGNSRRTGGAFYMTPQAEVDDGLLDFVYALKASRLEMFKLLPQTFKGKHIHHP
jgi:YegS/Rv2252/BmrU family lipid kinase